MAVLGMPVPGLDSETRHLGGLSLPARPNWLQDFVLLRSKTQFKNQKATHAVAFFIEAHMTKDEVIAGIHACAKKLGKNPSKRDLRKHGLSSWQMIKYFGSIGKALQQAGMRPEGTGFAIGSRTLLLDWAAVARKLEHLPAWKEYARLGGTVRPHLRIAGAHGSPCRMLSVCLRAKPDWKKNGPTCCAWWTGEANARRPRLRLT
jgi:hypothetical protein